MVKRAKGVLIKDHGLSEEEAFKRIRKTSVDSRKIMREIAEVILLTEKMGHSLVLRAGERTCQII